ncbi:MAG: sulfatase-like hydrolase/transferase, partial [Kiritimatiellia bacterium]|nr:sulfatase-like hydrolase/transferase [Kiritimatiellia bacterium]
DHGYDTRAIGKMHFQPVRRHSGFHKMELMEEIPKFREDDEYALYLKKVGLGHIQNLHGVRNLLYMTPQRSLIPDEHHGTTWVGDRCVDYLRAQRGKRPFFLWGSWIAPHPPFDVTEEFAGLYDGIPVPDPIESETPLSANAMRQRSYMEEFPAARRPEWIGRMRRLYFAAISMVDRQIGRILETLDQTGQSENTLVLFASDHGEMLGDHGCGQKMLPYDSCARIPFLIRYPKAFQPGAVRDEFVDLNDILPTVLDAASIAYPGPHRLPGSSLLASGGRDRKHQYMEYHQGAHRWISLRDARYKFNYYFAGGVEELFDLETDPGERRNLLATGPTAAQEAARARLRARLLEHESVWGLQNNVEQGDFLRFPPLPEKRGPQNSQFPVFQNNLSDPAERAALNDIGEETIAAVRNEPLVRLHEMDLDAWQKNGAPESTIERIRKEAL